MDTEKHFWLSVLPRSVTTLCDACVSTDRRLANLTLSEHIAKDRLKPPSMGKNLSLSYSDTLHRKHFCPTTCNLPSFKSKINKLDLISLSS